VLCKHTDYQRNSCSGMVLHGICDIAPPIRAFSQMTPFPTYRPLPVNKGRLRRTDKRTDKNCLTIAVTLHLRFAARVNNCGQGCSASLGTPETGCPGHSGWKLKKDGGLLILFWICLGGIINVTTHTTFSVTTHVCLLLSVYTLVWTSSCAPDLKNSSTILGWP
jgi:hypothetical protein